MPGTAVRELTRNGFCAERAVEELEERSTDTEVEYFMKLSVFVSAAVGHCSNN